jgi:hypothetical protein
MPPMRRFNRVYWPKVYWEPPITTPHRHQPPLITIYSKPTKPPKSSTEPLDSREESQYRPRFLPIDRAGKPQNLPGGIGLLGLTEPITGKIS